jgi:DnaJ-domain-containing protein 1
LHVAKPALRAQGREHNLPSWEYPDTLEEVKAAYRAKVRKYHPDRVNDLATEFQELADRRMKEINQAYERACRIKCPTSRR